MFLLLLLCCLPGGKAESAFWIDQQERFGRMARPYAQGYAPLIQQHVLAIDLPLLSETAQGPIEATFVPRDAELMPVKADQPFSLRAAGRQVAREGKALRQYLLSFRLALYPDRLNGDYPYAIDVKGADAGGGAVSQRFQFVLHVADGTKNQEPPRGEVVSFRPETPLLVGESGRLLVALKNASATRTLQGLSLRLSDPAGHILPAQADTLDLGPLLPGEQADVQIPVDVLHRASAEPHQLELELTARHAEGEPAKSTLRYSVPVAQEARLRLGEPQLPRQAMQGENVSFSMNFMNMGKGKLNNILMRSDIEGFRGTGSVLIGSLEPGESRVGQVNLRAGEETGEKSGQLLIENEDSYGKPYSTAIPLESSLVERPTLVPAENKKEEAAQDKTNPREYIAWGSCGLLIVIIIAQSLVLRRKIRRLEEKDL